jgi:hypothetical protein
LVEQWSEEPRVGGSIPSLGTRLAAFPLLRTLTNRRFRLMLACFVAAVASLRVIALVRESFANMDDYRRFFVVASRMAWQGVSPYRPIGVALPRQDLGNVGSFMTPPFLMLFRPWTLLGDDAGRAVWITLELLAVVGTLVVVYRGMGRPTWAEALVAASLLAFFPPLRDSLQEGQIGLFLGLAFALALLGHQRGRPWIGGMALGAVIAIKLTPILVLPYFIYRRDWRLCLAALATAAALASLTLGLGWAHYWPAFISDVGAAANGTALVRNQSLNGILLRVWRPELNGLPIVSPGLPFRAAWLVAQALVVAGLVAVVRKGRLATPEREWTEFSIIVLLLPLVQPYAWEHHFAQAIMIVPVVVHLVSRHRLGRIASLALGAVFICYLLFEYPGFLAANAAAPAALKASLWLQLAASVTTIVAILSAVLLASAGRRVADMRLLHLARFMRVQHR